MLALAGAQNTVAGLADENRNKRSDFTWQTDDVSGLTDVIRPHLTGTLWVAAIPIIAGHHHAAFEWPLTGNPARQRPVTFAG
ncbi:MAG: hypothetical protein R3292_05160 [Alcanivorax sp.]|nr:hypothetical protein [Alcanivorax sp.]